MTDRINSFTVVLEADMRDDDITHVLNAIKMVKNVIKVTPNVAGYPDTVATARVRQEVIEKLVELIQELNK